MRRTRTPCRERSWRPLLAAALLGACSDEAATRADDGPSDGADTTAAPVTAPDEVPPGTTLRVGDQLEYLQTVLSLAGCCGSWPGSTRAPRAPRVRMHALVQRLCARHRPAVLLVTHDVDEAVLLADRVLVLADGRLAFDAPVDVPSPRLRGDARFLALRSRLLAELGVDEAAEGARPDPPDLSDRPDLPDGGAP